MKIVKSIIGDGTEIFEDELVTFIESYNGKIQMKVSGRLSNIFLALKRNGYIVGGFIIDKSTEYNSDTVCIVPKKDQDAHISLFRGIYPITDVVNCKEIGYKLYYCDYINKYRPLPIGKKVNIILKSGKCITGILKDIEDPECRYISIDASSEYESKIKKIKVKKIKTLYL